MSTPRALLVSIGGITSLIALRLLLIATSAADVLYWEEPYRLVAVTELLAGPTWPIAEYQADHYQGGSLAVTLLAAPIVAGLGPAYGHVKLVALAFAAGTAALWIALLWRAAGPVAAALGAWLLALAPPMAQLFQVHAMGSHAETTLFTAAAFLLTLEIVGGAGSRSLPFLLGVVAGLGLWFCYSAATGAAACGIVWKLAGPRDSVRRGAPSALGGLAVGLMPWLAYNVTHAFHGLDRLWELFDPQQAGITGSTEPFATRLAALVALDLPRSMGFPAGTDGTPGLASWLYYALAFAALTVLATIAIRGIRGSHAALDRHAPLDRHTTVLATLILTLVTLHLAAYLASAFRLDVEDGYIAYRFFAPLFPPLAGALALVLVRLLAARRTFALAGISLTLGLGAYGTATLLREHPGAERPPITNGYTVMGLLTHLKYRHDLDAAVALLSRVRDREYAFIGFGWGLEYQYEKNADWPEVVAGIARCTDPADYAAALRGVRWAVGKREEQSREFGNAGYRPEYHHALHTRIADLAARVHMLLERSR